LIFTDQDPKFQVGSEFNSADDFRLYVRQHSIIKNFNLRWANTDKKKVIVKCANKGCKWFMRASRIIDGQAFQLKTLNPNLSCCGVNKSGNNSAFAKWVTMLAVGDMRENHNITPKERVKLIDKTIL